MVQNARITAFTVSELLREDQQGEGAGGAGGKLTSLPTQIMVKIKINLNFNFNTSLWYLKRFHEGL